MNIHADDSKYNAIARNLYTAKPGDENLGPLKHLPGKWKNRPDSDPDRFNGRGWNMIALPFEAEDGNPFDFRVLANQYNEVLSFDEIDGPVPNRGINRSENENTDQFIFGIDYQQAIKQIVAGDVPASDVAGGSDLPIHHEPGFFLNITNQTIQHEGEDLDVARLGSIPHGNTVLAMGKVREFDGPPVIPTISALPIGLPGIPQVEDFPDTGAPELPETGYLGPYAALSGDNAFRKGEPLPGVDLPDFPGFDVVTPNGLLQLGLPNNVIHTTELHFDTKFADGNIVNIPFIERQADASEMISTFWIMTLDETDAKGDPVRVMAYSQLVFLDFFERRDGIEGLIRWPHVSINMMMFESAPAKKEMNLMATV